MPLYPVFLDLAGRRALVLGTGEVAQRKAEPLRRAGADVTLRDRFDPADLNGIAIAIGADAAEEQLQALAAACRARGIPVNVVDRPDLCSFLSPATVERDPIVIAISTAGAAPVLARLLRARIEAAIPPAWGRLAALAGSFKEETRRLLPDSTQRRRLLERIFAGRVADLVFAGHEDAARAAFAAELRGARATPGIVYCVAAGPGDADLLTLRALRLLGEADVIVHDPDVGEAVLATARRDAPRIPAGPGCAGLLAGLARDGRKVVRLCPGRPDEAAALRQAGVLIEEVPGALPSSALCDPARGSPLGSS